MNKKLLWFVLSLAVIAAVTFAYSSIKQSGDNENREVAAFVNGKPIYMDEVQRELLTIAAEQRQNISNLEVLDFLIEKRLLLEASEKEGIIVTRREIEELYRKYANPNYFDLKATEALIAKQNLTEGEFLERLAEQAAINRLLEQKVDSPALARKISGSEVEQIYESNFRGKNISLDDAEADIVFFILQKRKENLRTSYINSLKRGADILSVMEPAV